MSLVADAQTALGWREGGQYGSGCLSQRELEVIALLARGLTNKQIARELLITPVTVKHHLSHIFCKLNVENRLELAVMALSQGLVIVPTAASDLADERA